MRRVLITGAAGELRDGVARCLVNDGWGVILDEPNIEAAQAVAFQLGSMVSCEDLELAAERNPDTMLAGLAQAGGVDALVNIGNSMKALGVAPKPFLDQKPAEWRRLIDANLYEVFAFTRAFLQHRIQCGGGIVSLSSSSGLRGAPKANAYSATRAGIQLFTQNMAVDCAAHGVRINCVSHCETDFPMTDSGGVPLPPPLGEGEIGLDAGHAVVFLLSKRASHITGSCIDVSGGWSLY